MVTNKGPPEHDPEILKVKFIIRAHKAHPPRRLRREETKLALISHNTFFVLIQESLLTSNLNKRSRKL